MDKNKENCEGTYVEVGCGLGRHGMLEKVLCEVFAHCCA